MTDSIDDKKSLEHELKTVLRAIEAAQSSMANELGKGGNLPHAYSELQNAHHKLARVLRKLG